MTAVFPALAGGARDPPCSAAGPWLAEGAGGGLAEDGDEQAEQRDSDDRDGNHEQPRRADGGQGGPGGIAARYPAELPDDRGDREDDQAAYHGRLEHHAAEGGERHRGPRPGQRRALPRQPRVAFLRVVGWAWPR